MGLVLIGLAFKIAVVPFHHWVPDVYQGAPTNVTGFMAAATKTAAFAALLRFLVGSFGNHADVWVPLVTVLSILTMTVANLVALAQRDIKRLLAFSSISHAGYLLIAVVCQPEDGVGAIVFYLAAYAFMTIGAFAVAAAVGRGDANEEVGYDLDSWAGLGWRRPALALAMSVFLFSMAGIPPTGGFFGKYVIFQAAVRDGQWLLAVVGCINAVIGAYYYLKVVVAMWMKDTASSEEGFPLPVPPAMAAVMAVAVIGVLYLGIAPGRMLDLARGLVDSIL
jgi:NADH-quinone oxidoreductase subunit N